jgi:hypothetical protein
MCWILRRLRPWGRATRRPPGRRRQRADLLEHPPRIDCWPRTMYGGGPVVRRSPDGKRKASQSTPVQTALLTGRFLASREKRLPMRRVHRLSQTGSQAWGGTFSGLAVAARTVLKVLVRFAATVENAHRPPRHEYCPTQGEIASEG